jgi:hypothetical protein
LAYASIIESSGHHGLKIYELAALIDELKGDDVHCAIAQLHNCTAAPLGDCCCQRWPSTNAYR